MPPPCEAIERAALADHALVVPDPGLPDDDRRRRRWPVLRDGGRVPVIVPPAGDRPADLGERATTPLAARLQPGSFGGPGQARGRPASGRSHPALLRLDRRPALCDGLRDGGRSFGLG